MKHYNNTIIITSMTELCRWMQKDNIEIVKMTPVKGIANEDVMKVEYKYRAKEALV